RSVPFRARHRPLPAGRSGARHAARGHGARGDRSGRPRRLGNALDSSAPPRREDALPFELTQHPGYFVVRCFGIVSPDDLKEMVARAAEIEEAHPEGVDRVSDFRDVEVFNTQYAIVSD